jgi:hypothetical protein
MPVIYRDDNRSQGQKAQPAKLGNGLSKTKTTIYPAGQQVRKSNEPMKPSEDIWDSFTPTKGKTI